MGSICDKIRHRQDAQPKHLEENEPSSEFPHRYRQGDIQLPNTTAPRPPSPPHQGIYVAMYDYEARSPGELSFREGERMAVLDKSPGEWWLARLLETEWEGYVPAVYITLSSTLYTQDWYFGRIGRGEAYQLLMSSFNEVGSYLIRESDSGHGYTLSAKVMEQNEPKVKHYRITKMQDDSLFLEKKRYFYTLNDLVNHYRTEKNTSFYTLLKYTCKKKKPVMQDMSWGTKDKWEIDRSTIEFREKLGQGNFGQVMLGYWNKNVEVAVKTLKEGTMTVEAFMAEAQIMKGLKHPNILVLYAVCTQKEPILIVTEYMSEGSLLEYLRDDFGKTIFFNEQLYITCQIADAMAYLEGLSLVHRDLAARNVLVGPSLTCKVADFGLARALNEGCYNASGGNFPVKWTAPEALTHGFFTIKSDVWSFGVLMMEIITYGAIPYPGMNNMEVTEYVANGYRIRKPRNCPEQLYELSYSCWLHDPEERPTFAHIRDYVSEYNVSVERSYAGSEER